jgi:hypothetical protein
MAGARPAAPKRSPDLMSVIRAFELNNFRGRCTSPTVSHRPVRLGGSPRRLVWVELCFETSERFLHDLVLHHSRACPRQGFPGAAGGSFVIPRELFCRLVVHVPAFDRDRVLRELHDLGLQSASPLPAISLSPRLGVLYVEKLKT